MADPILTREQFDFAVKNAPAGLSKEQFGAYLDAESKRIHQHESPHVTDLLNVGKMSTPSHPITEGEEANPSSPTMAALEGLAHPKTVSDFASLAIPEVPSVGRLVGALRDIPDVPTATRAAARIGGKALNALGTTVDIIPGSKLGGTADVLQSAGAEATKFGESPHPNVLQGSRQFEPGNIPERLSPAAQPPARVPFRMAPAESPVLQGAEMFKPGNIPPRAAEAFGQGVNPEPLQFGESAQVLRGSDMFAPGAVPPRAGPPIQVNEASLSPLESQVSKRMPMGAPSMQLKTAGWTPAQWSEAQRYYGSDELSKLTGVPAAQIQQMTGAPHQLPLSEEVKMMDRGGPTNP
jgi:hypothetical protein